MKSIQTFSPYLFKKKLIRNMDDNSLLDNKFLDNFFIHSFKNDKIYLKLPLPPHKKTVNDIAFVKRGRLERTIGIEEFVLKKNDFLFTPKDTITTTKYADEDLDGFFCHFTDDFLQAHPILSNWSSQAISKNYLHLSEGQAVIVEQLFERILLLYKTKQSSNMELIVFYLLTLMAELSFILQDHLKTTAHKNPVMDNFNFWIKTNLRETKSIKEIANALCVSPNHLNKVIKHETGRSASDNINSIILLEAKYLLLQTNMNINEIAQELGFADSSYFTRFFKKHSGIPPSIYRERIELS